MLRRVALARPGVAAAILLLAGCASFSQDGGFDSVNQLTRQRLGTEVHPIKTENDERALAALITQKLQTPLSVDDAVTIALLNNRGLQATYASLGIAEADLVQAGRLTNPAFGFKRTHSGDEVAIERTLTFNLLRVLTLPLAGRIESRRFEQTKLLVADAALKMAYDTRRAYFEAIAAQQSADYAGTVNAAAAAGAELATRMTQAGNWSQLDLLREQAFHVDAIGAASRATKDALAAREKLTRLLGLSGDAAQFRLPERLPDLPAAIAELPEVEQSALRDRLDVRAGQLQLQETAASLGLTRTTRFVNVLDLGLVRNSATGQPSAPGYEVTLEIPLFDWGGARVARAEASYLASAGRLAEIAVNARSEARESHANYRAAWQLARHYRDQVLPLRKRIADEMQLRYNGMLASPFALLADAREQANAGNGYITALKDYWIADTNLQAALGGRLPVTQQGATP